MNNRISWICRGVVAASVVAYAAMGDPLWDALVAVHAWEQTTDAASESNDDNYASDSQDSDAETVWTSRLVQQPGSGRLARQLQNESSRSNQRNQYSTLRAFKESVGDKWKSTVQVFDKSRQIALGAIVSSDGWIITKASEIPNRAIEIKLYDQSKAEGTVKYRRNDLDLALIKIDRKDLPAIQWNTTAAVRVGGWLATTDIRNMPIAIGVMGVASRNIRRERAVLGVELGTAEGENGALVERVTVGSGADRAGLQAGDVITTIDGDSLRTQPEVMSRLKGLAAGQRVDVGIIRNGKKSLVTAQMMDLNYALLVDPTEMEVNGEISSRSSGFQNVMQHDSVIAPHQCGGPIVDVYGNAVGLNIARAGRVSSYAIPAAILSPVVTEMIAAVSGLTSPFEDSVVQTASSTAALKPAISLPTSVPNNIVIEALKPEVVIPSKSRP